MSIFYPTPCDPSYLTSRADLDPIYYCELMKLCDINDHGDANITSIAVTPQSGPQGRTNFVYCVCSKLFVSGDFKIDVQYVSKNGTGTGEAAIGVNTVDGIPVGKAAVYW